MAAAVAGSIVSRYLRDVQADQGTEMTAVETDLWSCRPRRSRSSLPSRLDRVSVCRRRVCLIEHSDDKDRVVTHGRMIWRIGHCGGLSSSRVGRDFSIAS